MISIEGVGLHTGRGSTLRIFGAPNHDDIVVFRWPDGSCSRVDALVVDEEVERSTKLSTEDGAHSIQTVEHLFAALGALSIHRGLRIEVDGEEIPLSDGCARSFFDQLTVLVTMLDVASSPRRRESARMHIVKPGTIEVGASTYQLHPEGNTLSVTIDFDDSRLVPFASWTVGDAADFRDRIAPARTFAFEREIGALLERGLANHVSPESIVVIGSQAVHYAGQPFTWDEPVRHKLLDLIGDLYAHGGPPAQGSIRATRPGHRATHRALAEAKARKLIVLR